MITDDHDQFCRNTKYCYCYWNKNDTSFIYVERNKKGMLHHWFLFPHETWWLQTSHSLKTVAAIFRFNLRSCEKWFLGNSQLNENKFNHSSNCRNTIIMTPVHFIIINIFLYLLKDSVYILYCICLCEDKYRQRSSYKW